MTVKQNACSMHLIHHKHDIPLLVQAFRKKFTFLLQSKLGTVCCRSPCFDLELCQGTFLWNPNLYVIHSFCRSQFTAITLKLFPVRPREDPRPVVSVDHSLLHFYLASLSCVTQRRSPTCNFGRSKFTPFLPGTLGTLSCATQRRSPTCSFRRSQFTPFLPGILGTLSCATQRRSPTCSFRRSQFTPFLPGILGTLSCATQRRSPTCSFRSSQFTPFLISSGSSDFPPPCLW